jgi:hypothetical protein
VHSDLLTALETLIKQHAQRPNPEAMTIKDFCVREQMSASSFHKLQNKGLAPDVRRLPGMTMLRITNEAYEAWKKRMAKLQRSEANDLQEEREQRRARNRVAGKLAAESPIHVSKKTPKRTA